MDVLFAAHPPTSRVDKKYASNYFPPHTFLCFFLLISSGMSRLFSALSFNSEELLGSIPSREFLPPFPSLRHPPLLEKFSLVAGPSATVLCRVGIAFGSTVISLASVRTLFDPESTTCDNVLRRTRLHFVADTLFRFFHL